LSADESRALRELESLALLATLEIAADEFIDNT
jgi:hypothetical protein